MWPTLCTSLARASPKELEDGKVALPHLQILRGVERALDALQTEFRQGPSLFFTEHDLASRAYHLIQQELGYQQIRDLAGEMNFLVHHEYPTPFRCDMHKTSFAVVDDEARTPRGGKFRRGHYDLVVINPEFIRHSEFQVLNGQNYGLLKRELPRLMLKLREPPICYGIELIYKRRPFSSVHHVDRWFDKIRQDLEKLEASKVMQVGRFMQSVISIAFNRDTREPMETRIKELFSSYADLVYCAPQGDQ